jgi:hypothetical protein
MVFPAISAFQEYKTIVHLALTKILLVRHLILVKSVLVIQATDNVHTIKSVLFSQITTNVSLARTTLVVEPARTVPSNVLRRPLNLV